MTTNHSPESAGRATPPLSLADANSIVLLLDGRGKVVYLNPFGLHFFGYRNEEIIGRPAVGTIVPQTDQSGSDLAAMIADLLRNPDAYTRQINENRLKSGQQVWVIWSNRAFRDADGTISRILCVGIDITDHKAFVSLLEESRVQLTATIQKQNRSLEALQAARYTAVHLGGGFAVDDELARWLAAGEPGRNSVSIDAFMRCLRQASMT